MRTNQLAAAVAIFALVTAAGTPRFGLTATEDLKRSPIRQPLRVHPRNSRYFYDGARGVYLGGHQIFVDLQDNTFNKEWTRDLARPDDPAAKARLLDWKRYLDYAESLGLNYQRGWIIWSTGSGTAAPPNRVAFPMPFQRTGPARAADGLPAFDLRRFDEEFFRRIRGRAADLQRRGIYLSVMLFEPFGFLGGENVQGQTLWDGNLFKGGNNINGIDVDRGRNGLGEEFFRLDDAEVAQIQKAYVRKMVDTLNDLNNVLWELCNEPPAGSLEWQREMLRYLKACEARKRKQHPILWSVGSDSGASERELLDSPADCFATMAGWIDAKDPKVYPPEKPVFFDLDHIHPGAHDPTLVWKAFTRGYHFNLYDSPFEQPQDESPEWQSTRRNVGLTAGSRKRPTTSRSSLRDPISPPPAIAFQTGVRHTLCTRRGRRRLKCVGCARAVFIRATGSTSPAGFGVPAIASPHQAQLTALLLPIPGQRSFSHPRRAGKQSERAS